MALESRTEPLDFPAVLREGVVVTGVLIAWGLLAVLGVGVRNLGGPGSYLVPLGEAITQLFLLVGLANALLYVIARGIQLSRS